MDPATNPNRWHDRPCLAKRCLVNAPPEHSRPVQVVEIITPDQEKVYLMNEDGTGWMHVHDHLPIPVKEIKPRDILAYLE